MSPDKKEVQYYTDDQSVMKHMSHEDGESWAVSYADVLMVLLSFFVIFFKIDDKSTSAIVDIKKSFDAKKKQTKKSTSGILGGVGDKAGLNSEGAKVGGVFIGGKRGLDGGVVKVGNTIYRFIKLSDLAIPLKSQIIKMIDDPDHSKSLQLDFSPNVFKKNSYTLTEAGEKDLKFLMSILKPHYQKIQIDIIGHTDAIPILNKTKAVENNFDLSVLRASKALNYFLRDGAYSDAARAMGVSHHTKSSRTITIKIKPVSLIVQRERPPLPKHLKAKYNSEAEIR